MGLTMHAILVDDDRNLVWSEVTDATPDTGQILVEIHAAGLNRADLLQRAGNYPPPDGWPEWMGLEMAGVVLEAPGDSRWHPGDRVCALLGGGGYAERIALPPELALPVPDGLSMVEAAAIPEVFATAYLNLCMEGGMQEGDTVLIQAGASGLGTAAMQMAKAFGATVMTTVSTPEKVAFVRNLGADIVINRHVDDLDAAMDEHAVDIALDCIAGPELGRRVLKLAPGGRWIVIATLGGAMTEMDMNTFFRRGLRLIGSTLRSRPRGVKAKVLADLEARLWPAFSAGDIRPVIYQTVPMPQAAEAQAILENRENIGKVVLTTR